MPHSKLLLPKTFLQQVETLMDLLQTPQALAGEKRASMLHTQLHEIQKTSALLDDSSVIFLVQQLEIIVAPLLSAPYSPPSGETQNTLATLVKQLQETVTLHYIEMQLPITELPLAHLPLLIGLSDKGLEKDLAYQIKYFGYPTVFFGDIAALSQLVQQSTESFSAILLDIDYCQEEDLSTLQNIAQQIPLIFISTRGDVSVRLFAVRAAGKAFLLCPF